MGSRSSSMVIYEFYGNICWLSVEREADVEVLEYLATLLSRHL